MSKDYYIYTEGRYHNMKYLSIDTVYKVYKSRYKVKNVTD